MNSQKSGRSYSGSRRTFLKTVGIAIGPTASSRAIAADESSNIRRSQRDSWTGLRSGPERTGMVADPGPTPYVTTDWKMDLDGSMYDIEGVVANGTIYLAVTTNNSPSESAGYVGAYDVETGSRHWKRTGLPGLKTPSVADDTLYFATRVPDAANATDNGLYALHADSGNTKWTRTACPEWVTPAVTDEHVYTSNDNGAYALDSATGNTVWQTDTVGGVANGVGGMVSYADGTVFYGDGTALHATDGSVKWRAPAEKRTFGNHAVGDGRVYYIRTDYIVGEDDTVTIEARSTTDGNVTWTYDMDDNQWDGRLAIADGYVFLVAATAETSAVKALNAETGETEWTTSTNAELLSDPTVADGTVYIGGRYIPADNPTAGRALIYALDATTGDRKWGYLLDSDGLETSPEEPPAAGTPVVADGRLYTATYPAGATLRYRYVYYSNFFALDSCGKRPSDNHRLPQYIQDQRTG